MIGKYTDIEDIIGEPVEPFYWLRMGRVRFFPLRGADGGLTSTVCAVLCDASRPLTDDIRNYSLCRAGFHEEHGAAWYVVELNVFNIDLSVLTAAGEAMGAPAEWLYPPKPRGYCRNAHEMT